MSQGQDHIFLISSYYNYTADLTSPGQLSCLLMASALCWSTGQEIPLSLVFGHL